MTQLANGMFKTNPAWAAYNNAMNEGGEGFNPHPKFIKSAAPAAGITYFHGGARYTRAQLITRMEKSEAAAIIGGETFGADARANVAAIKKILGL